MRLKSFKNNFRAQKNPPTAPSPRPCLCSAKKSRELSPGSSCFLSFSKHAVSVGFLPSAVRKKPFPKAQKLHIFSYGLFSSLILIKYQPNRLLLNN